MAAKRSTTKKTTRKPRVTAAMRQQRAERLAQIGEVLPLLNTMSEPIARWLFLDLSGTGVVIDDAVEHFADAPAAFSHRGNWDFDPTLPPPMVVDLDGTEFVIRPLSYSPVCGMELDEGEFVLEAARDYDYVPEAGGDWRDAYCWPAPTVNPDLSPLERCAKLGEWLVSECRYDWRDPDDE